MTAEASVVAAIGATAAAAGVVGLAVAAGGTVPLVVPVVVGPGIFDWLPETPVSFSPPVTA